MAKVAVVTDSDRGMAFGLLQILLKRYDGVVYLTSKDEARGTAAVAQLNRLGLHPEYHQLDVADRASVSKFRYLLKKKYGGIDILVNNAEEDSTETCTEKLLFPFVRKNGVIFNISSECEETFNIRVKYCVQALPKTDFKEDDIKDFLEWFMEGVQEGTFNFEDVADDGTVALNRVTSITANANPSEFEMNFAYNVSFKYAD